MGECLLPIISTNNTETTAVKNKNLLAGVNWKIGYYREDYLHLQAYKNDASAAWIAQDEPVILKNGKRYYIGVMRYTDNGYPTCVKYSIRLENLDNTKREFYDNHDDAYGINVITEDNNDILCLLSIGAAGTYVYPFIIECDENDDRYPPFIDMNLIPVDSGHVLEWW